MRRGPVLAATAMSLVTMTHGALAAVDGAAVIRTYGDIAQAMYQDSHAAAERMKAAIDGFLASPSDATMKQARDAWIAARVPYQQTEGYRFGNAAVDDWEGRVNAWPLDEGMIDYVDAGYGDSSDENPLYTLNVVATPKLRVGAEEVDASTVTPEVLGQLHEAMDVEANVSQGYHAVEFLLWGQDLNGTDAGAGERPWTDFSTEQCTHGNCDRRRAYLEAATDLLVTDLKEMADAWAPGGPARQELDAKGTAGGLTSILTGLGSLSYGELAGERMKLGLLLHDPEEEHDCFADNTHNSHYYNQVGMMAIWSGRYTRTDGEVVRGPSIAALADETSRASAGAVTERMNETLAALEAIKASADSGTMAYDQMLGEGNAEGNAMVQAAVDRLVAQAKGVEAVVADLGLQIAVEGSDSLDAPETVAQ